MPTNKVSVRGGVAVLAGLTMMSLEEQSACLDKFCKRGHSIPVKKRQEELCASLANALRTYAGLEKYSPAPTATVVRREAQKIINNARRLVEQDFSVASRWFNRLDLSWSKANLRTRHRLWIAIRRANPTIQYPLEALIRLEESEGEDARARAAVQALAHIGRLEVKAGAFRSPHALALVREAISIWAEWTGRSPKQNWTDVWHFQKWLSATLRYAHMAAISDDQLKRMIKFLTSNSAK